MGIDWNGRTTEWFRAASDYTGFNRKMAKLILQHTRARGSLCDIGCGAALADFELRRDFVSVTCVDLSGPVIDTVNRRIRDEGITNMRAICADGPALTGQWDVVTALFHGGEIELVRHYLSLSRECFVTAVHVGNMGQTGPQAYHINKCFDTRMMNQQLAEAGFVWQYDEYVMEYGQPLRTMEEAAAYTRCYAKPMPDNVLQDYLCENLVITGRQDYPYYLPKTKHFGLYTIPREPNASRL